jgi:hypothetical protein
MGILIDKNIYYIKMNTDFVKKFDCNDETHVMWLKDVGDAMTKTTMGEKVDLIKLVNENPLDGTPKMNNPVDWAYIHFQLAMKYSNAVLNQDAFLPGSK